MTKVGRRRIIATTLTLIAVGGTALVVDATRARLGDESTFTGWTLLGTTALLYLLTVRKKLIRYRMGPVASWMQFHVYAGSFASIVFLMHIGWPVRGYFETALAGCFVFVASTGIFLGYLSRVTPRRLAALPNDNHQEFIPALQATVASNAHLAALSSSGHGEGATLAEFYQRRLLPYFRTPRGFVYQMVPTGVLRRRLTRELFDLDRYLGSNGTADRRALTSMIKAKDDLDYQYALQYRLKFFVMLHMSMTWSLLVLIAVHIVLVYRFQGTIH